ncbi:hypothetical protein D3C81_1164690 [compost metagenome]
MVDITAHHIAAALVVPLVHDGIDQCLFLGVAAARRIVGPTSHQLGIVRVHLPQPGQLRAERQGRITGAPDLLAVEVLGRALDIQAVLGVEVNVPAYRTCVILGIDVGAVSLLGDVGEYRLVGVGALVAAFLGRQLPFQGLVGGQAVAGAEVEAGEAAAVAVVAAVLVLVEAIVLQARHRQAHVAAVPAKAVACVEIVDAVLAAGDLEARAMAVGRVAGEDVDHRHQRIGAIADRVGATEHLDALDVLHGQGDVAPVHCRKACAVYRAAIDQHLHAPCVVDVAAMVVDRRLIAGAVADHHARHQAQQFGDVAGTAGADQFAVEHGHAAWDRCRGLFEAGGGQNLRQVGVVDEQIVGHGRAAEQGGQ